MQCAVSVDPAVTAPACHHDLHETSLTQQTLGQPFESCGRELNQQIDQLALEITCNVRFAHHNVDLRLGNGCFPPALFLKELNPLFENRSRLFWGEICRASPFGQAPYSPF